MARNVILATILVFLIVADVSNASFFFQIRKLVDPSPKEDPNVSPVSSPVTTDGKKSSPLKEKENEPTQDSNKPKGKGDLGATPPSGNKEGNGTPMEVAKDKGVKQPETPPSDTKKDSKIPKEEVKEICNGITQKCHDTKSMIACVKISDDVSKVLVLLIQNEGDSGINVNLMIPPPLDKKKLTDVPEHQIELVNVSLPTSGPTEIRLNAGNGDCILRLVSPESSQHTFFRHLPSYSKLMTPIYGAYLLFLIILIFGGLWACCWFKTRRSHSHPRSEIPYQELEMSVPETAPIVETREGWDEVWDDDWDEEKAVKSPGAANISGNGLSSRILSKDGWEDWND